MQWFQQFGVAVRNALATYVSWKEGLFVGSPYITSIVIAICLLKIDNLNAIFWC